MNPTIKSLILYAAKCITGAALVIGLGEVIQYHDVAWCLISVVLVLSPDSKEAIPLAVSRIKANLTGGSASLLCLLLGPPSLLTVGLAMAVTIALCQLFQVMPSSRTALAAVIIVMLHGPGSHIWDAALERISAVVVGCILGLLITFLFHQRMVGRAIAVPDSAE